MPAPKEVTKLLVAWSDGDESALEELIPLVYDELYRLARRYMVRERVGHTLQTTALVNEAYLRMVDFKNIQWQNRAHFFAVSAQVMRRILVDFARSRKFQKRGGDARRVSFDEALGAATGRTADLVALDDALNSLAVLDPRKSKVVELRFFGGLTVEEAAHVLKVSVETIMRDWKMAKAWLLREMSEEHADGR
ncbi:MAG TPA: sigma-70 family RNA polymerase sigma factor [Blastocatellia bacterium]|jgi:RNA polymerase sigma factor (TIGR02999 family)|nr:sigma-70 family RNA polymerase sigma factor [Blastocatellia bacterium]